ncbi:MAG TPA: cytochrome c biogenesis protein CcsA [Thermoanaerobaculia bacterium]|nr:cytochrome c biogenesis protein CcsA [Thermoanaerobaculia bacterium]
MSALSHLYLPGALTLWCAVAFAIAALWGYVDLARGDESARPFARRAYLFFALSIVAAAGVLLLSLARRDFRIDYVFQYSGLDLPWSYQLAAFWAGQKGSFLIWLLFGALIGLPLRRACGRMEAPVVSIYLLAQLGLLFILVRENPFLMLDQAPIDGQGLNPLLQDDWMVIHPPIMFVGYALAAVPFAFAMAALYRRDTSDWATRAFPWALAGFLVLGTAILLGGYWAYATLGWGGYWGWDPVENASLIPWLFGTALVHGLYLEKTRGRFRRSNLVLASLVFLSVLYGTFLTRSGVLADFSVHSFVDLGISGWLIALMAFFGGMAAILLGMRLKDVETAPNEDPPLSRGTFLVLATITILVCAIVVTLGTSAPILTSFMESPGQVGPSFYNTVNLPIAMLIALLLSFVPFTTWGAGQGAREMLRRAAPGLGIAFVAAAAGVGLGVHQPLHVIFLFLAVAASATNLQRVIELARNRQMARAGGYLAHVGVGIILVGILGSSAYDESVKVTLVQGEQVDAGDVRMTFVRFLPREGKLRERAEVAVTRSDGSTWNAYPQIFVNDRTRQLMVHPAIRSGPLSDLYLSPLEYDPGRGPGDRIRVRLRKGERERIGSAEIRFDGFDLDRAGNALAQMAAGETVEIGAHLAVLRDGATEEVTPVYRFRQSGQVEFPPVALPGGGMVAVGGIDATSGAVELIFEGLAGQTGTPARLSLDVTYKPLVQFVWWGIYVVLAGGILALVGRVRQVRRLDAAASAPGA